MSSDSLAYDAVLCLSEDHRSGARARQFARQTLAKSGYLGRHEDVVLVVSELVSNALLHAVGAPVLRLFGTSSRVRVEVSDESPALPAVRRPGAVGGGGWGLNLVQRLVTGWGAAHRNGGKVVWCELTPSAAPAGAERPAATA